jgi:hypothetical protein
MKGAGWSPGNDDQQIWYTTTADGHTFADQAIVPGALTASKPALRHYREPVSAPAARPLRPGAEHQPGHRAIYRCRS